MSLFESEGVRRIMDANPRVRLGAVEQDQKLVCPECLGGSTKEKSLSFKIDANGGAVWHCHRATCGCVGNVPGASQHSAGSQARRKSYRRPTPPQEVQKPDALYAWFERRGISRRTVDRFGIYRTTHWVPQAEAEVPVTAFPYTWNGTLYGVKYRYDYRKEDGSAAKTFAQEKDTEPSLYNADSLNADEVVFCEGELDVAACYEAGITHAVSLRDGAGQGKNDKRFDGLKTHWQALKDVRRFVLAGDSDEVGIAHQHELARRLGREKCHLVEWPEGCKDSDETLIKHGPEAVKACILAAKPYPIEGLYSVETDDIAFLDDTTWMRSVSTGSAALDRIIKVPEQGRLWVVTGVPSSGKSTWLNWLMMGLAIRHDWKFGLFSPETDPWQLHAQLLMEVYTGKRWRTMTAEEKVKAVGFVGPHFVHIVPTNDDDPDGSETKKKSTLDWLEEQIRICVLRDGIRGVLVDPWNELEHARPSNINVSEYINDALRRLKATCRRYGIHLFLVAHPKKMQAGELPTGYSVSDSSAFFNKADFGITVHQPLKNSPMVEIHVWKCRFRAFGQKGQANLLWDETCDRYGDAPEQPHQND